MSEVKQTQDLPATYNRDEALRKVETERQLIDVQTKLQHLLDINESQTKLMEEFNKRTTRIEDVLFGKDYLNGMVQQVAILTRWRLFFLCTLSAIASSGLTIVTTYVVKHL